MGRKHLLLAVVDMGHLVSSTLRARAMRRALHGSIPGSSSTVQPGACWVHRTFCFVGTKLRAAAVPRAELAQRTNLCGTVEQVDATPGCCDLVLLGDTTTARWYGE